MDLAWRNEERFGNAHAARLPMFRLASSNAACVLGGAIDFVGENHVGENRAGDEGEFPFAAGVLQNLRAGVVSGHEVGCELDALELEMKNLRDGFHEQRLGQPGCAGDETMPAGEQRNEQLLDDILLADDDFGQLGLNARASSFDLFDGLLFRGVG
jgi:hypothetical protein